MNKENEADVILLDSDYSEKVFSTCLYELFGKHDEGVAKYIKPGRKFWYFDGVKSEWRKLTVTYVRSDVMFYTFDDEPDVERAWFKNSIACLSLCVAEVHPYEIADILSEWYPEAKEEIPEICRRCKWYDHDGNITVDVVWDA